MLRPAAIVALSFLFAVPARAETVVVAVASNFTHVMRDLAAEFEAATSHEVRLTPASTGKLYAQLMNGAPYDVFVAADAERPAALERAGLTVAGSRFTFARGRLTLWSADAKFHDQDCAAALRDGAFRRVAVPNPATAPYGVAAVEVLEGVGQPVTGLTGRIVYGESVAQTLQFVATGGADLGLVASSLLYGPNLPAASCRWDVPADRHAPLVHDAVMMKRAGGNPAARAFVEFLQGDAARERLRASGYDL